MLLVVATPLKVLDAYTNINRPPDNDIKTFVSVTAYITFKCTQPPSSTVVVTPQVGNFSQYVSIYPTQLVLTANTMAVTLAITGIASTRGAVLQLPLSFSGPVSEFRIGATGGLTGSLIVTSSPCASAMLSSGTPPVAERLPGRPAVS